MGNLLGAPASSRPTVWGERLNCMPVSAVGVAFSCLCLGMATGPHSSVPAASERTRYAPMASTPASAAPTLSGRVVTFARNGYEPDGDPVDRVVISAGLHDRNSGGFADTTLVLSTYLENFQTATVPILPDLLRKDVTATSLGGFMQGKAALVDGAGRVRYRGGLLAEVFLDNSIHMVVDLDPQGMPASAASLRLFGALTLRKNLTLDGAVRPARTLLPSEVAALYVVHPRAVSWRAVVAGLHVRYPKMMGTSGSGIVPGAPTAAQTRSVPPTAVSVGRAPLADGPAVSRATGVQGAQAHGTGGPSRVTLAALGVAALALLGAVLALGARTVGGRRPS